MRSRRGGSGGLDSHLDERLRDRIGCKHSNAAPTLKVNPESQSSCEHVLLGEAFRLKRHEWVLGGQFIRRVRKLVVAHRRSLDGPDARLGQADRPWMPDTKPDLTLNQPPAIHSSQIRSHRSLNPPPESFED